MINFLEKYLIEFNFVMIMIEGLWLFYLMF